MSFTDGERIPMRLTQKEEAAYIRMGGYLSKAFDPSVEPLTRLNQLVHLQRQVEETLTGEVGQRLAEQAKKAGATWESIAIAVGVTKQMAWHRWGKKKTKVGVA